MKWRYHLASRDHTLHRWSVPATALYGARSGRQGQAHTQEIRPEANEHWPTHVIILFIASMSFHAVLPPCMLRVRHSEILHWKHFGAATGRPSSGFGFCWILCEIFSVIHKLVRGFICAIRWAPKNVTAQPMQYWLFTKCQANDVTASHLSYRKNYSVPGAAL